MSHHWDSGFMVRTPSWHKLENAVLENSPTNWEEARQEAGLTWDVITDDVWVGGMEDTGWRMENVSSDWQALRRDDTRALLSIQPTTYQVVRNEEFGGIMDTLMGVADDEHLVFEALMSLYGGRQVVALLYFEEPLVMPWDDSKNFSYLAFSSRHDGNGGIRGIPTNVRVQCANTLSLAESVDGSSGFTIRHSSNWESRVKELSRDLSIARENSKVWIKEMEDLSRWAAQPSDVDRFLTRMFPISDDMTTLVMNNRMTWRDEVRGLYEGATTTDNIRGTGYGLLMATTEWTDHVRSSRSTDAFVSRQLLAKADHKVRATRILKDMAAS